MICPHCKREIVDKDALKLITEESALELISEEAILRKSGSIRGARGRGPAKARDPELMRAAGKLGGRPKKKKPKHKRVTAPKSKKKEPVNPVPNFRTPP
jgi:hypothetical protein